MWGKQPLNLSSIKYKLKHNYKLIPVDEAKQKNYNFRGKNLSVKVITILPLSFDINSLIPFFPVRNKYPAIRFTCKNFDNKRHIDKQVGQLADENKRDLWKDLISSYVAYGTWYYYAHTFLPVQKKYPATRLIFHNFDIKRILTIKRYKSWRDEAWYLLISCITFLPMQTKYPANCLYDTILKLKGILIIKRHK